jgi:hypothetical protein
MAITVEEVSVSLPDTISPKPWTLDNQKTIGDNKPPLMSLIHKDSTSAKFILTYDFGSVAGKSSVHPDVLVYAVQDGVKQTIQLFVGRPFVVGGTEISVWTAHGQALAWGTFQIVT